MTPLIPPFTRETAIAKVRAAADALVLHDTHRSRSADLAARITAMQSAEGYFGSPDMSADLRVFHTASCVMSVNAQGAPTITGEIESALRWLAASQDPTSGAWGSRDGS